MGSGGYSSVIPKWQRMEADLLAKGIHPFSLAWPERSKNWFFAHGGSLDPQIGELIIGGEIRRAAQRLIDIVDASASGAFVPNREKDELTYALQTPEHHGRQRVDFMAAWLP